MQAVRVFDQIIRVIHNLHLPHDHRLALTQQTVASAVYTSEREVDAFQSATTLLQDATAGLQASLTFCMSANLSAATPPTLQTKRSVLVSYIASCPRRYARSAGYDSSQGQTTGLQLRLQHQLFVEAVTGLYPSVLPQLLQLTSKRDVGTVAGQLRC